MPPDSDPSDGSDPSDPSHAPSDTDTNNGASDCTVSLRDSSSQVTATYNASVWYTCVGYGDEDAFCLRKFAVTSGPLEGRTAFVMMPTSRFRFLDLPVEIRAMIYEYLMTESGPIQLRKIKYGASRGPKRIVGRFWRGGDYKSQMASIVKVNHQIHREASEILYGTNQFELSDHTSFKTFVHIIGASWKFLRRVRIPDMPFGQARNLLKSLSCAPMLQKIELNHVLVCDNTPSPKARVDGMAQALSQFVRLAKRSRGARGIAGSANDTIFVYHSSADEYAAEFMAANEWMAANGRTLPHRCLCGPEEMKRKSREFCESLRAKLAGL